MHVGRLLYFNTWFHCSLHHYNLDFFFWLTLYLLSVSLCVPAPQEIRQLQQKQESYIREISDLQETIEWKDKKIGVGTHTTSEICSVSHWASLADSAPAKLHEWNITLYNVTHNLSDILFTLNCGFNLKDKVQENAYLLARFENSLEFTYRGEMCARPSWICRTKKGVPFSKILAIHDVVSMLNGIGFLFKFITFTLLNHNCTVGKEKVGLFIAPWTLGMKIFVFPPTSVNEMLTLTGTSKEKYGSQWQMRCERLISWVYKRNLASHLSMMLSNDLWQFETHNLEWSKFHYSWEFYKSLYCMLHTWGIYTISMTDCKSSMDATEICQTSIHTLSLMYFDFKKHTHTKVL